MKKIIAGLCCLLSMTQAIEIDVPFVKSQALANKTDIGSRVLLMKYYFQNHDYTMAKAYMKEILSLNPTHDLANKIKKQLRLIQKLEKTTDSKDASVGVMLESLYTKKSYQDFVQLYEEAQSSGISLADTLKIDVADAYHHLGKDNKALAFLEVYHDRDSQKVKHLKQSIALAKAKRTLETSYNKEVLKDYIYLLKEEKMPKEMIRALKKLVKVHPQNSEIKIALAENLYWQGKIKEAFHALYPARQANRHAKKLYANILYDMKDYSHALYYLPDVVKKEQNAKERFMVEKKLAYAYLQLGKHEKANRLFAKLLKQNPEDKELLSLQESWQKRALLDKAIAYHKAKDLEQALSYYKRYYDKSKDPKIAKEIAEIYYFSHREKLALSYFEAYLDDYPKDSLIRFHYASVLEKEKQYQKSAREFKKIVEMPSAKEYYLAKYHAAYSLMHTHEDKDWLEAREILHSLISALQNSIKEKDISLLKYVRTLYKEALDPIKKPMRYKDIILTEGSYKQVDQKEVFSLDKISFTIKPSASTLLPQKERPKIKAWLGMDYVEDSALSYSNYKIGLTNIVSNKTMQVGVELQNFFFDGLYRDYDGMGFFVNTQAKKWNVALGVDHFEDFDMLVPKVSWSSSISAHSLFLEAYYRNGAFVNYRNCMVKNKSNVYHVGLSDSYILEDLSILNAGLDINYFEDGNTNLYGQFLLPLYHENGFGVEHKVTFNENVEYNSKVEVCSHPSEFYDSSYVKYQPKLRFKNGYIEGDLGAGYAFKNRDALLSYGFNGAYTIEGFATLNVDCERLQSSFTGDEMTFFHLTVIQAW